jgi:molybdopterin-guanine dinucleotide biosynthesis protein MobB
LKPRVVAVVGRKKSGKTAIIELLTRELVGRGYRVAAVKHIPEPEFTIDQEGKDTWRFVQAGATTVVGVSEHEIATIERINTHDISLERILRKCKESDLVLVEGFRDLVSKNDEIAKILVVTSAEETAKDLQTFHRAIALTGITQPRMEKMNIPFVNSRKNLKELADLIEKIVLKRI